MRCYFNVRSKADISQLDLPHGRDAIKHYQGVFWAGCLYKQAKQLQRHNFIFTGLPTRHNGLMGEKVKAPSLTIILTNSVSVEAIGCEQLAQSRRTQPRPARDRTRDLLIATPTPYRCATTPRR